MLLYLLMVLVTRDFSPVELWKRVVGAVLLNGASRRV